MSRVLKMTAAVATAIASRPHEYHYIGRPRFNSEASLWGKHFGNPFSHVKPTPRDCVAVATREEAVEAFRLWINELAYLDVEVNRRYWILDNLILLHNKNLVCFCAPQSCHGDILRELVLRRYA